MNIEEVLCFDDVLLVPNYFAGKSRKEVSLKTNIAGLELDLPIISANMPVVSGINMAKAIAEMGGLAILDRITGTKFDVIKTFKSDYPTLKIGASIGVLGSPLEDAKHYIDVGADILCIDVAHGMQASVFDLYRRFRNKFSKFPLIIGNFAEPNGLFQIFKGDCNLAIKMGVGSGAMCTTRVQTGCGLPTLESLIRIDRYQDKDFDIIADGGIKNSGDIVKSLAAGADAVMIGSLLAGTDESPGEIVNVNGKAYKIYRGSASAGAKAAAGMATEFVEGAEGLVPIKGPTKRILKGLEDGIRSGLSYCGSFNLTDLRRFSKFVKISPAGYKEGLPHGTL